jgi:hypothetical protein
MTKNNNRWLLSSIFLLSLILGCNGPKGVETTSTIAIPVQLNSITPQTIPTSNKTPLVTPTAQKIIPGTTATFFNPTATLLSPTYAPTMTDGERTAAILGLLKENAGCKLPCWWGFVPGITHWQDANLLFQGMGKTPEYYKSSYYLQLDIPEHYLYFGQTYYTQDDLINFIYIGADTSKNGHFIYGDPVFEEDFQNYLLPNILEQYGAPDEILLRTFLAAPEGGDIPFYFVLFYGKTGIMVI